MGELGERYERAMRELTQIVRELGDIYTSGNRGLRERYAVIARYM